MYVCAIQGHARNCPSHTRNAAALGALQVQNMDRPVGVALRVQRADGNTVVQVMLLSEGSGHAQLQEWRCAAEAAWHQPGHPGWQLLTEEMVSVGHSTTSARLPLSAPIWCPVSAAVQVYAAHYLYLDFLLLPLALFVCFLLLPPFHLSHLSTCRWQCSADDKAHAYFVHGTCVASLAGLIGRAPV